jgi:hypothetical protein
VFAREEHLQGWAVMAYGTARLLLTAQP